MKNQEIKIEKAESKKDSVNLASAKINLKNSKKELATKQKDQSSRKDLYVGVSLLSSEEQKKFRGKIRRDLHRYVNNILALDRSDEEKEKYILEFLEFYKKNWKIQDFKIENFSMSQNPIDRKDYSDLLEFVKSTLE